MLRKQTEKNSAERRHNLKRQHNCRPLMKVNAFSAGVTSWKDQPISYMTVPGNDSRIKDEGNLKK